MAEQIFISYCKKNWECAHKIYNSLLSAGYLVWIDLRLKEGEKWRPQIDHNLKVSKRFIVFISLESINESKWVPHEISMAYGRDIPILPVKIKEYKPFQLPIGVEETQLFHFSEDPDEYDREIRRLINCLGLPVAIVEYMESLLILYETSEALLSEHQLRLYERHKSKIVWPKGKETLGRELIEKSYRDLQNTWDRYNDLEKNYIRAQKEIDRLSLSLQRHEQRKTYIFRLTTGFLITLDLLLALYIILYITANLF
jgi:hypothetical protein